jgi:hypothetical protein
MAITIGTGTNTGYISPYNNYYKNSTTEMIYPAASIGGAGIIKSIAFNVAAAASHACTLNIYMAHKASATFSGASDYVAYSDMTLVYSGDVTLGQSTGWETITLTSPFTYNGTDNLVIIVCRTASSYTNSLKYYYEAETSTVLYRRNDSTAAYADPSNTSYSYTVATNLPNIQIEISTGEIVYVTMPVIKSASYATNPASANAKVKLSVVVTEEEVALTATEYYCAEFYSGEV